MKRAHRLELSAAVTILAALGACCAPPPPVREAELQPRDLVAYRDPQGWRCVPVWKVEDGLVHVVDRTGAGVARVPVRDVQGCVR